MVDESAPAQAPATRTDYTDKGVFSWSAGDAISVLFHKDNDNKFFTLTTTESGATVKFSGSIEAGYEIGASDGTVSDKKIWALFPASANHTYTAGSFPKFYVQPSVDFSATHFSANIPMYALNADEGAFSFTNIASTYKFIVTGIKDGVDKVQFRIHNQETYGLSGLWDIINHGSTEIKELEYEYASPGSANSTLTYINNVTSNQAVFYVSCRYWGHFQPVVTVTNCATGVDIKTFTASTYKSPNYMDHVWPITLDVSEANGGNYYVPAVLIDGDFDDWDGVDVFDGSTGHTRINAWRMQADESNVYVYMDLVTEKITADRYIYVGFDTDSDTGTGTTRGGCPGCEQYCVIYPAVSGSDPITMIQGADPRSTVNGSSDGTLTTWCNMVSSSSPLELCIPRSKVGLTATASIKVSVSYDNYVTAQQTLELP